jgi:hypothetical protein
MLDYGGGSGLLIPTFSWLQGAVAEVISSAETERKISVTTLSNACMSWSMWAIHTRHYLPLLPIAVQVG